MVRRVDTRPVIQAGVEFGVSYVRLAGNPYGPNPHGINDDWGVSTWRRLDLPGCVPAWQDLIRRARALDCQGVLWWQPMGYVANWPVPYHIDSHCVPPEMAPQLAAITALTKAAGMWSGSLLRPAEIVYQFDWDLPSGLRFSKLSEDIGVLLKHRIDCLRLQGRADAFYLDSFGTGSLDGQVAAWLRGVLGPAMPLYAEWPTTRVSPYCGAYAEWDGIGWSNGWDNLPRVGPMMQVVGKDLTNRPFAERAAWGRKVGVAPLVLGHEVP